MNRDMALRLLAAALTLGVAGDYLLRGGTWHLGFFLWMVLLVGFLFALHTDRPRIALLAGLIAAAFGLALRDAPVLFEVDLVSVICMGALCVWQARGRSLRRFEALDGVRALVDSARAVAFGVPNLLRTAAQRSPQDGRPGRPAVIITGIVIAVPPIFMVAALLGSSDPVFAQAFIFSFESLWEKLFEHLIPVLALAALGGGWLRGMMDPAPLTGTEDRLRSPSLEFLTVSFTLYGLAALLTIYLGLQARVLFGGAEYLASSSGLTVAEYARAGFFELVAACVIVFGTLIAADWLLDQERESDVRSFRVAGSVLVGLILVLMVSAVARMSLYVETFGLSVDRLTALSVMFWLGLVLIWFAATVLRQRRANFGPGLLVTTIVCVAFLNLLNPEAVVVRVNGARAARGLTFDVTYHAGLSADATGALYRVIPGLPSPEREQMSSALREAMMRRLTRDGDWRSLNISLLRERSYIDELDPAQR